MFSRRLPLGDLAQLCRQLRHSLGAGVGLLRVLRQMAERGPRSARPLMGRVEEAVQRGELLSDALEREKELFPPLFLALVKVGEETGNLPETLRELESYFQLEFQLRRQLRSHTLPIIIQFLMAVFVVAGMLFVLGAIASSRGGQPLITLFGLSGAAASLAFLGVVFGTIFGLWFLYTATSELTRQRAAADRFFLSLPALGPAMESLALSRFTLALQLTLDSGLPITKALKLSLQATANAAYAAKADVVVQSLKSGEPLYEALRRTGLFAPEFIDIVASSEEGGRVPEMMRHQAAYYQEESARRLTLLARAAAGLVWLANAAFIIWMIFRIAGAYIGAIGG